MADHEHLQKLRTGVDEWNRWRTGSLHSRPELGGTNLRASLLDGVNLSGAILREANLSNAHLEKADLRGANLNEANLSHAKLTGANLVGATLRSAILVDAEMRGASLRSTDLREASLIGAQLGGADLSRADLRGANLSGATLTGAKLNDANLSKALLTDTDLGGASLSGANLSGTNLNYVNLKSPEGGSQLDLSNANLNHCVFNPPDDPGEDSHGRFLNLSSALGLDSARFSEGFLSKYIAEAFVYAHAQNLLAAKESPGFLEHALEQMTYLEHLYSPANLPSDLVGIVNVLFMELTNLLQSNPEALGREQGGLIRDLITKVLLKYGWDIGPVISTIDHQHDLFAIRRPADDTGSAMLLECKKLHEHGKVDIDIVRSLYRVSKHLKTDPVLLSTTSDFGTGANATKASYYLLQHQAHKDLTNWIEEFHT